MNPPTETAVDWDEEDTDKGVSLDLVDSKDANPFGGADVEQMISVAHDNLGKSPDIDGPSQGIALQGIAKAVSARIRNEHYSSDPKALSVFLISERPRDDARQLEANREPIVDNGAVQFSGRLWISGPAFRSAYRLNFTHTGTSKIFEELEEHKLDRAPVFVFDPSATDPELRYYPRGVAEPDTVQLYLISQHDFSVEVLDRVLQRFYETAIRTPDSTVGGKGPWADPAKYVPIKNTESYLQNLLKVALNACFQEPYSCEFEKPGDQGRCDLMLVSRHPVIKNSQVHHAVMELKVLRSLRSSSAIVPKGEIASAIDKGLKQAIAYKKEQNAETAMLCCFDMRTIDACDHDDCLTPIRQKAEDAEVALRRYRIYGSSEDFRSQEYGA